jgi:hypothetical protein
MNSHTATMRKNRATPTSTVGRSKAVTLETLPDSDRWFGNGISLFHGDSLNFYSQWPSPSTIVSDGAYGILGFEGDTSDHLGMAEWYQPHIEGWSAKATGRTTLWFWNSEIGWATVHPVLEKNGWRYINANVWSKGLAHIAGNVNTAKIRRFPVVTEMCVQYVFEPRVDDQTLQHWLYREWKRTGLPMKRANDACGVKDVAVRKYLDQGHLWYFPPPEMFEKMARYANEFGKAEGRPFFSLDGKVPGTAAEWAKMRSTFNCPMATTNVWARNPLKGVERVKVPELSGRAAHLNQKPLDLMRMIVSASSLPDDTVWEPFGGLFSASLACRELGRHAFAAEIDSTYYQLGVRRFTEKEFLL